MSAKRECLNHFFCFRLQHVDQIVQTYIRDYNRLRPHQSVGNVPLSKAGEPPPELTAVGEIGPVQRYESVGGLLNHYERKAA